MSSIFMRDPNYPEEMWIDKELIVAPSVEGRLICSQLRRSANRVNYRAQDNTTMTLRQL